MQNSISGTNFEADLSRITFSTGLASAKGDTLSQDKHDSGVQSVDSGVDLGEVVESALGRHAESHPAIKSEDRPDGKNGE